MLAALINVIFPVVLVASVGVVLARAFPIDIDSVNKVSLHGFTPALAYVTVVTTDVSPRDGARLTIAYLLAMAVAAALAYGASLLFARRARRVVVGCTIIGNNGNFGLPIALLALGQPGLDQALVIFMASLLLMFTIGPALLGATGGVLAGLRRVALLPVMWALVIGLTVRGAGLQTPAALMSGIQLLADGAIPLVLLCLGLQLGQSQRINLTRPVLLSVALRAVVVPLAAYGAGLAVGLHGLPLQSLVLACVMPTAVNAYMLAREFSDDPSTAASAVALSTFVSIPLIAGVVTLLPLL
ncbi:AEC family transporter [Piscicoccus intestinalis]|uniref:AEC family transporter n=1 Tax=Piscicoccus intestinalis TaxID=746033 RepID=UPI000838EA79|nr:AEC family transporter [Piscicoccus intestinalis]